MKEFLKKLFFLNWTRRVLFFFLKKSFLEIYKRLDKVEGRLPQQKKMLRFSLDRVLKRERAVLDKVAKINSHSEGLKSEIEVLRASLNLLKEENISLMKRVQITEEEILFLRKDRKKREKTFSRFESLSQEFSQLQKEVSLEWKKREANINGLREKISDVKIETTKISKNRALIRSFEKKVNEKVKEILKDSRDTLASVSCLYQILGPRDPYLKEKKGCQKGKRCFLIGSGPSINQIDFSKLKDEMVMGVNGVIAKEGLSLDYFCSVSYTWWQDHSDKLRRIAVNERVFLPSYICENLNVPNCSELNALENKYTEMYSSQSPLFFSEDPSTYIVTGGTVIFVSLQILHYLGFEEVILLGVDHNYEKASENGVNDRKYGQTVKSHVIPHFSPDYYSSNVDIHMDLRAMERGYNLAREFYESSGRKILNATPGTKLNIFEKVQYDDLFSKKIPQKPVRKKKNESSRIFTS